MDGPTAFHEHNNPLVESLAGINTTTIIDYSLLDNQYAFNNTYRSGMAV